MGGHYYNTSECFSPGQDCCSAIDRNYWIAYLVLVLVLHFAVFDLAKCKAGELPTAAEIKRNSEELQNASSNVQGEMQVFRSEAAIPLALEKPPSEIGIPLVFHGKLWRSTERFRVDYTSIHPKLATRESQHSIALDGIVVYQLSSGVDPNGGMLTVCDADTAKGTSAMQSIKTKFYGPLDALWKSGNPFVDLLQRPGSKIVPSQMFPGSYSLLASADDGTKAQFEFEAANHHPLGYYLSSVENNGLQVKIERRVLSGERNGRLLPTRIAEVASINTKDSSSGYTEVVILDLKPLEPNSPIAQSITPSSFHNMGFGYQVYNNRKSAAEEIDERYERTTTLQSSSASTVRSWFLWVNGFLILTLLALLIRRRTRNKRCVRSN